MTPSYALQVIGYLAAKQSSAALDQHVKSCPDCAYAAFGYCPTALKIITETVNPRNN